MERAPRGPELEQFVDLVRRAASGTLQLGPDELTTASGPDTHSEWDSVAHLQILLEIEHQSGMRFTLNEMTSAKSILTIAEVLWSKARIAGT
jgi:acyl carrier protein